MWLVGDGCRGALLLNVMTTQRRELMRLLHRWRKNKPMKQYESPQSEALNMIFILLLQKVVGSTIKWPSPWNGTKSKILLQYLSSEKLRSKVPNCIRSWIKGNTYRVRRESICKWSFCNVLIVPDSHSQFGSRRLPEEEMHLHIFSLHITQINSC